MKTLLARLLTLTMTFLLIFGTLPASAFVVETTQRAFYDNGGIKNLTTFEGTVQTGKTVFDAMGNAISGVDKEGKPFWATYDAYGNRQTYVGWNSTSQSFCTTYSVRNVENGVQKGFVSVTLDGVSPLSYDAFKVKFDQFVAAVKSGASTVDPKTYFGAAIQGISGSGSAIMNMFGSKENLAKIFKPGWDRENAAKRAEALKDWNPAEHKPSESVSYTKINENPSTFANAIWAEMLSDPNATVTIGFGGDATITSVTVDHARGDVKTFKPGTTECKVNGTDPIVSGQVLGFTTIDGQQYMIVSPEQINMFQNADYNAGFQDANAKPDEVIYIAVTDEAAAAIAADMEKGNNTITIAGDVVQSVDGHATMKMNEGGYATGTSIKETQDKFITDNANGKSAADQQKFYSTKLAEMKSTWENATAQQKSDWRAGWALIEAGL